MAGGTVGAEGGGARPLIEGAAGRRQVRLTMQTYIHMYPNLTCPSCSKVEDIMTPCTMPPDFFESTRIIKCVTLDL